MARLPRLPIVTALGVLVCALATPLPASAQEGFDGLCALLLHESQVELEDSGLAVSNNETRLAVDQEIFELVDGMWQNDLIERLPYLAIKHRRDVSEVTLQQSLLRRERQQASLDQYRISCLSGSEQQETGEDSGTIDEARERYITAECSLRELDVQVAQINLEYHEVLLESQQSLRQNDIASRQQVLFAERDVEFDRQALTLAEQRVATCRGR